MGEVRITDEMVEAAWAEFEGRPFRVNSWYEKEDIRAALSAALSGMTEPADVAGWQLNSADGTWISISQAEAEYHRSNGRIIRPVYAATPPASGLREANERLRKAIKRLMLGYVSTMEAGRDRIMSLGGTCDPVDVMEASDPHLVEARAALNPEGK